MHMKPAKSLRVWAEEMGLSYRTAWRLAKAGKLPKPFQAIQLSTGTIRIIRTEDPVGEAIGSAVIYARINCRSSENELLDQVDLCSEFCYSRGWQIERIVRERAPGFGPARRKLHSLLTTPPRCLVVARPSVISRFDLIVTEILLRNLGCNLVVINHDPEMSGSGGALEDLTDAISSTCHLHYGPKRGRALVEDLNRLVLRGTPRGVAPVRRQDVGQLHP